jgi:MFS family permease
VEGDQQGAAEVVTEPVAPENRRFLDRVRMVEPLRSRDFAFFWTATTLALVADGIYYVAVAWQVYELSNAPTALSIVGVAWSVPMVVFVLWGGVAADRFDRRLLIAIAGVARTVAMAALAVLALTGAIELWQIVGIVVLFGAGEAFAGPATGAIVPDLVPERLLVQANALGQLVEPLGWRIVGPALGGVAVATSGPGAAFTASAACFLLSAVAVSLVRARRVVAADAADTSALREIAEGYRFVRSQTWLWGTLLAAAVSLLAFAGPYEVLIPYLVKNELGGGADDLGLVFAAGGAGALLAALLVGQLGLPRRVLTFAYVTWAASVVVLVPYGLATELWHMVLASVAGGAGFTAGIIAWTTLMHRIVPGDVLGRVTSLDWFVSVSLMPVSFAITGPVADALGPRATLVGAGLLATPLMLAFLLLPGLRDVEARPE